MRFSVPRVDTFAGAFAGTGATNGSGAAAEAGVGVVPLPPELVAGALSDATLALLAPQPLSLRLALQPAGACRPPIRLRARKPRVELSQPASPKRSYILACRALPLLLSADRL